jgi:hypothetical protein
MQLSVLIPMIFSMFHLVSCTGAVPLPIQKGQAKDKSAESLSQESKMNPVAARGKLETGGEVAGKGNENGNGNAADEDPQAGNNQGQNARPLNLAWMPVGDFPSNSAQMSVVSECTRGENVIRSACQTANSTCKSTFQVTCDTSTDCRRLFKCTTGQTGKLIWFPMGDNIKVSPTVSKICTLNNNIAGASCDSVDDKCLSGFCVSGSGADCGRRLFKCLTSGEPGKLFWRWVEDKPSNELAGKNLCTQNQNIAGSGCTVENDLCQSSFCVEGEAPNCTKIRLFKCTP